MTSSRPYLLRAIYEWLLDNELTPYIMVDAMMPDVHVPERHIEDGKIILNIEAKAVGNFRMGNDAVEFDARFSGVSRHIFVPIISIKAIYAAENGRGMVFSDEEDEGDSTGGPVPPAPPDNPPPPPPPKGRPTLKIVK